MAWAEPKIYAYTWQGQGWAVEIERMEEPGAERRWTLQIFLDEESWDAPQTFADPADAAVAVMQRQTKYDKWDGRAEDDESPPEDLDRWEKDFEPLGVDEEEDD